MKKFESGGRDTEDDPAQNQPSKRRKTRTSEGLKQAKKATLETLESEKNPTCPSGPSTSQTTFPQPPQAVNLPPHEKTEYDLNPVAQKSGVNLQPECTSFPTQTCDPAKEDPKPLHPKPAWSKLRRSAPPGDEETTLGAKPKSNLASQKSKARRTFPEGAGIQENEPNPPLFEKSVLNIQVSNNKGTSNKHDSRQSRLLSPRTKAHSLQKEKEIGEDNSAAEAAGSHLPKTAVKPADHLQILSEGILRNVEKEAEGSAVTGVKNTTDKKAIQEGSDSAHTFHKTNTALGRIRSSNETQEKRDGSSTWRQKHPVMVSPEEPNRPSELELQGYQKCPELMTSASEDFNQTGPSAIAPLMSLSDQPTRFWCPAIASGLGQEVMAVPSMLRPPTRLPIFICATTFTSVFLKMELAKASPKLLTGFIPEIHLDKPLLISKEGEPCKPTTPPEEGLVGRQV